MHKLRWIIPEILAGGQHPLLNDEFNLDAPDFYTKNGIKSVISVFEVPLSGNIIKAVPWSYFFEPTADGTPPKHLGKICEIIAKHKGTFVHCFAGTGRTATVLAAYLLHAGHVDTAKEAIIKLRKDYDSHAVHTPEQYLELLSFNNEELDKQEIENDVKELFTPNRPGYRGKKKYEKLFDLGKKELVLIEKQFGKDSLEYQNSHKSLKKTEHVLNLFKG